MTGQDRSQKKSRKSKSKKRQKLADNKNANSVRDKGTGFQRMDAVERVPSNAPTMAIAPSDYEHIFHEGPTTVNQPAQAQATLPTMTQTRTIPHSPSPPPPPLNIPKPKTPDERVPQMTQQTQQSQVPSYGRLPYSAEVQVTPDGYTLLGQIPDPVHRRALPPHIVRASNQFSRAVLVRVSKYLASRS